MPTSALPFVDDHYDESANPPETRPTATNSRFPLLPAKPNVTDGYSRSGLKFAERVLEAANQGRSPVDQLDLDDLPEGLIRAFEAVDAAPSTNVSKLAAGSLKTISTGEGQLLAVEVLVNPMAIMPDPMNGRTVAEQIMKGRRLITASRDADPLGLPVFPVDDAAELLEMVVAARVELGFEHLKVAPGKDYQDLISIGLQGAHEPLLLVPSRFHAPDGSSAWTIIGRDGNRRQAMLLRGLKESTGLDYTQLHAWAHHFNGPDGTARLRNFDSEAVNALRRTAHFGDLVGGTMHPQSTSADAIESWLAGPATRSVRLRTITRCRAATALIVVGYDISSLTPSVSAEDAPSEALVERIVRRRHIAEAAQKPWSEDAQNLQVATAALRRVKAKVATGGDFVPLDLDTIGKVIDSDLPLWIGANNGVTHPLRVAAKLAATLTCDNHDGTDPVKQEMKAFAIPVTAAKVAENRAKLAAERLLPILGFKDSSNSRYRQVRTVVDRLLRPKIFTDCAKHPDNLTCTWWEYLDTPVEDLAAAAAEEKAALAGLDDDAFQKLENDADGTGTYGPATRAMVMLAALAAASSPMVVTEGGRPTPFVLTQSGLGGARGNTATSPDAVMFRMAEHPLGVEQMAEIIDAALSSPLRIPANVIDPDAEIEGDPSTKGYLTEAFMRGPTFGWKEADEPTPDPEPTPEPELTPHQAYQAWVQRFTGHIAAAYAELQGVLPGGDDVLREEFKDRGLGHHDLTAKVEALAKWVGRGDTYAERDEP